MSHALGDQCTTIAVQDTHDARQPQTTTATTDNNETSDVATELRPTNNTGVAVDNPRSTSIASSSSSLSTTIPPPSLNIIPPMKLGGKARERHGKAFYGLAWSKDYSGTETEKTRYLATVAGNMVHLYDRTIAFKTPKNNNSGSTGSGSVDNIVQDETHSMISPFRIYKIEDTNNIVRKVDLFTCTFGGRCVPLHHLQNKNATKYVPYKKRPRTSSSYNNSATTDSNTILLSATDRRIEQLNRQLADDYSDLPASPQLVIVGGDTNLIYVIDPLRHLVLYTLQGHGGELYDLQMSPTDEWLLLSASLDHSIRLWNLRDKGTNIAIFAGQYGHLDSVVKVAWHCSGLRFVSVGMDTTVKVWYIDDKIQQAVKRSRVAAEKRLQDGTNERVSTAIFEHFPIYSTNKAHLHCIDCVAFTGDLLFTKSIDNAIILWDPVYSSFDIDNMCRIGDAAGTTQTRTNQDDMVHLRTFTYDHATYWCLRFDVTTSSPQWLAIGNAKGQVYVWNVDNEEEKCRKLQVTPAVPVRTVSWDPDGRTLIVGTDQGTLWQWNVQIKIGTAR